MCGDKAMVELLGYKVDENGIIFQQESEIDNPQSTQMFVDEQQYKSIRRSL